MTDRARLQIALRALRRIEHAASLQWAIEEAGLALAAVETASVARTTVDNVPAKVAKGKQ